MASRALSYENKYWYRHHIVVGRLSYGHIRTFGQKLLFRLAVSVYYISQLLVSTRLVSSYEETRHGRLVAIRLRVHRISSGDAASSSTSFH